MFFINLKSKLSVWINLSGQLARPRQFSVDGFSKFSMQRQKTASKEYDLEILSATRDWRKVADTINNDKIHCSKSTIQIFNNLTANAFQEADIALGWKMLNQINEKNFQPNFEAFQAYWSYCALNRSTFAENVEKMFEFIEKNDLIVSRNVIESLSDKIKHYYGSIIPVELSKAGVCQRCKYQMPLLQQSQLEFVTLRREFERVVLRPRISPQQVTFFKQFVNKKKTYDYVVDSLNVSRMIPDIKGNIFKQGQLLGQTVEQLRSNNKKVLVVGKKHVNNFPEQSMNLIRKKATVFLSNDEEAVDDIYMMYAALISGPNSHFVTNDLLDDYRAMFSERGKEIFQNWQKLHQHFTTYNHQKGFVHIHKPKIFSYKASKSMENGQWHIPFTEKPLLCSVKKMIGMPIGVPIQWACVKFQNDNNNNNNK